MLTNIRQLYRLYNTEPVPCMHKYKLHFSVGGALKLKQKERYARSQVRKQLEECTF